MGSLLGKPKKVPPVAKPAAAEVTSKDRAMLDLKVARDKLKKYQKRVSACCCCCCYLFEELLLTVYF